jgi:hypothetical protein
MTELLIDQFNTDELAKRALRIASENMMDAFSKATDDAFMSGQPPVHYNCRCVIPTLIPPGQRTIDAEYSIVKRQECVAIVKIVEGRG